MAKDKSSKVAAAKSAKPVDSVKTGRVTKPADSAKKVAKDTAKQTAKAVEKSKKSKKVKEPTPEPSSDEEEDDDTSASSESSGSDDSDDEEEKPVAKAAAAADSDSEDSDDSSDDDEEEAKPKTNGAAKVNGAAAKDEDEEDDDEDESDSDSDSDEDEDEEEEETKPAESKKRKADDSAAPSAKKTKYTIKGEEKEATANLFVGSLSWNVDDDWLSREFQECEGFGSARVMTERDTGRSRGFGYVEFDTAENAGAALEALQGQEVDGRALNIDFSTPRTNNNSTPQQKSFDRAKSYGDQPKEPSNTLWVGNLSFDISQDVLSEYFAEHGSINSVRLPTDKETGEFKGFGYVEMSSIDEAKSAFDALQGADVAGRPMRLDFAGPRPERQDSFGGGRGGGRGGRGGFGGRGGGRGGFGDRGGRGGRGGRGDRGGRGGRGGSTNRGGFGDFSGKKTTF